MLQRYYSTLLHLLEQDYSVTMNEFGGYQFIYVTISGPPNDTQPQIEQYARNVIKGSAISFECHFVRRNSSQQVFRFRFLVPQEKMFCCGNGCVDCVRL